MEFGTAELAVVVTQRLQKIYPAFPQKSITFLLFDKGQDSYGDPLFWNTFIKEVGDGIYPYYRVILFCSYLWPKLTTAFFYFSILISELTRQLEE